MKSFIAWTVFFSLVYWALLGFAQAQFAVTYAVMDARNSQAYKILMEGEK
jgi:hypothetical protein